MCSMPKTAARVLAHAQPNQPQYFTIALAKQLMCSRRIPAITILMPSLILPSVTLPSAAKPHQGQTCHEYVQLSILTQLPWYTPIHTARQCLLCSLRCTSHWSCTAWNSSIGCRMSRGQTNTYQGLESAACGWHGLHCQVQTSAQTSSAAALQLQEQLPSVMLSLQTLLGWGHWGWFWLGPSAEPPDHNRLLE